MTGSHTTLSEDPPCIVGMGCRLPGGVRSPSGLWEFLMSKASAQGPIPFQRFNQDGFYHSDKSARPGLMNVNGGYFLDEDPSSLDNEFFGIHNLEAASMDPQQRKLLEVVYECLEDSGTPMEAVSGKPVGVFIGTFTVDNQMMGLRDLDTIDRFTLIGSGNTVLANRISHAFNLKGPSFTVDTACSSSLYALHSAIAALNAGDCDAAIVAAANLITSPEHFISIAHAGVLSPTSTCHTFDVCADGYGRGEAINALYLKRASDAVTNGDKIWAVIRGSAVNANGATPGIAQPSIDSQEALVRKAYSKSGLNLADTDYIECHGTGTPVGDPIEVEALGRCFGNTDRSRPLLLGSSKPGLGHSEAASGITSLIKVALSFEHSKIAPTIGVKNLNPKLRLDSYNFEIATEVENWPRSLRRASINGFGYGGSNAHIIAESASSYFAAQRLTPTAKVKGGCESRLFVLPVSAGSKTALESRTRELRELVQAGDVNLLPGLAYTLSQRISLLEYRQTLIVKPAHQSSREEITNVGLDSDDDQGVGAAVPLAFVFTGQGAQYPLMGKKLLLENECFRGSIRASDRFLRTLMPPHLIPNWTIEDTLLEEPETSRIYESSRSQPVCTAVQIALVDLLRSWRVSPCAVVGHSSGEIAAAYSAGLINASEAIITAYLRGYAVEQLTTEGAMVAVAMTYHAAKDIIHQHGLKNDVTIACINAPSNITLSGSQSGIDRLLVVLEDTGVSARRLRTGGRAYHSPMMREIGESYELLLAAYFESHSEHTGEASITAMYSSVILDNKSEAVSLSRQSVTAAYWRLNLEQPVQFSHALRTLVEQQHKVHLIEIGPHCALKSVVQEIVSSMKLGHASVPYSSALIRDQDADLCVKKLASDLFIRGSKLCWQYVNPHMVSSFTGTNLPPYPWDYSRGASKKESQNSVEIRHRRYPRHELLGSQRGERQGINSAWKNNLTTDEVPWLRDHRVESQVVFPAAGYIAMAIEAISQALRLPPLGEPLFELRHVSISTALVVPDDERRTSVEVHTVLCPRELTRTSRSISWHEFHISSFVSGVTTTHCSGSIRLVKGSERSTVCNISYTPGDGFQECLNIGIFYERFASQGMHFGPSFQSVTGLHTDSTRLRHEATGEVNIWAAVPEKPGRTEYAAHPIAIDACIQIALMGSAAGDVGETNVHLPVFIDKCHVMMANWKQYQTSSLVHATSVKTSTSTRRATSTLWTKGHTTTPLIHLQGIQLARYRCIVPAEHQPIRQPCLRVHWKPDIRHINNSNVKQLDSYARLFVSERQGAFAKFADNKDLGAIAALVDLVGHAHPSMRALELRDDGGSSANSLLQVLDDGTGYRRCSSWQVGHLDTSGTPRDEKDLLIEGRFELLVLSQETFDKSSEYSANTLLSLRSLLHGRNSPIDGRRCIIVTPDELSTSSNFTAGLAIRLRDEGATRVDTIDRQTICISLLELDHEFLAAISQQDMTCLQYLTDNALTVIWLSGAGALSDQPNPNLVLCNGFSRALILEQPALNFVIIDVGSEHDQLDDSTYQNIVQVLHCTRDDSTALKHDKEFIQKENLLYISRFRPDFETNALFRRRLEKRDSVQDVELSTTRPARLALETANTTGGDTLHFEEVREPESTTPEGFVDVLVKTISLNAKDVYTLRGKVETPGATTAIEFSGVVTAVGHGIAHLHPGDSVAVAMPCHLGTSQRAPVWATQKMLPGERYDEIATLPTIYATALYAIVYRAQLRPGDSILIHGGAGAFGFAALTVARRILGASDKIYTTAGTQMKKDFIATNLNIPASNIFNSRDDSFSREVKSATGDRGVDVVINFLTGDLLHAGWDCVAPFGRFVEIGKRDLADAGRLDMHVFLRNTTFTAFDLSELYQEKIRRDVDTYPHLLAEVFELYRRGEIKPPPITVFAARDIAKAYRYFSSEDRIGKIVITFEDEGSKIPVSPSRYATVFDPTKVYLLVGCLGGLGRSLSRWMLVRGAHNFVFLGRSGCDKESARSLVANLRRCGARVEVVRGDVTNRTDVDAAVAACVATGCSIGGVVQAAMGLREALFTRMTSEQWHTAIQPKWRGTWNLHESLQSHNLAFFLLTSSISGSVGTATESNYCAANSFLDGFASWRSAIGKPTMSVGLGMISEVGYLHENPDIEALLLRKGIQPLTESEFLQVIDLALSGKTLETEGGRTKDFELSHILTGLEPFKSRELISKGYDVSLSASQEPRAAILDAALAADRAAAKEAQCTGSGEVDSVAVAAEWFSSVPEYARAYLMPEASAESLHEAILRLVRNRFSSLVITPVEQIDDQKPLSRLGVDSMIASEFRIWFWTAFKVDVPFLDLMSPQKNLRTLSDFTAQNILS
ncbi:polyketide synthase-like protein [Xylariaceae sp. FL1272]|nr:polyketide synthase-like protein [Xylariaceae sp. FL1272]